VADADGGDHVDSRLEQVLDVLPPVGVAQAGRVAVGEIIDQRHLRPAREDRVEVHLRESRAPVRDPDRGDDLKSAKEICRVRPAVRLRTGHHNVGAVLRAPVALAEQCAGRDGPRCEAQVDPQTPAGGRFLVCGVSVHQAQLPAHQMRGQLQRRGESGLLVPEQPAQVLQVLRALAGDRFCHCHPPG
jgi:hypothetical protein